MAKERDADKENAFKFNPSEPKRIDPSSDENASLSDLAEEQGAKITRRMMLKAVVGGLALTPFAAALFAEPRTVQEYRIERHVISPLPEKDQVTFFIYHATKAYVGEPAELLNLGDPNIGIEGYLAFITRCTHFACVTTYKTRTEIDTIAAGTLLNWPGWSEDLPGAMFCPCHKAGFSPYDGSVLGGPVTIPLAQIELEMVDGNIYAVGVKPGSASQ
ncbi:MAG: ubiquinol-cytochrome c reductase iron-sulfur subunit [Candidatus Heimdallarchaeota archaeon]